jgi:hypothetical protein
MVEQDSPHFLAEYVHRFQAEQHSCRSQMAIIAVDLRETIFSGGSQMQCIASANKRGSRKSFDSGRSLSKQISVQWQPNPDAALVIAFKLPRHRIEW